MHAALHLGRAKNQSIRTPALLVAGRSRYKSRYDARYDRTSQAVATLQQVDSAIHTRSGETNEPGHKRRGSEEGDGESDTPRRRLVQIEEQVEALRTIVLGE
jgi:hypothetical protein